MTYRVTLSKRVLGQLDGFPPDALGALARTMAEVCDYPDDPLRTFPTGDPYQRRAVFGELGLVTYLIDDAGEVVTVVDVTWVG